MSMCARVHVCIMIDLDNDWFKMVERYFNFMEFGLPTLSIFFYFQLMLLFIITPSVATLMSKVKHPPQLSMLMPKTNVFIEHLLFFS